MEEESKKIPLVPIVNPHTCGHDSQTVRQFVNR